MENRTLVAAEWLKGRRRLAVALLVASLVSLVGRSAQAGFLGVASGSATESSAVLWTRTEVAGHVGAGANFAAQISTTSDFSNIVKTVNGSTLGAANQDYTFKTTVSGLQAGQQYYYRFQNSGNPADLSNIGTFKTSPAAGSQVGVKFGFSGDVDGLMRPYISLGNVAAPGVPTIGGQNFDFFVNLGDTIYETASTGSPAAISTQAAGATAAQLLVDFEKKYREQFISVNAGGQAGMKDFYAAQGNYTLLDNHELGNKQYINGGAPQGPAIVGNPDGVQGADPTNSAFDHNTTGTYINKNVAYQALQQAYNNYQPTSDPVVIHSATDSNTDGTLQMFGANRWGHNAVFVNVDDRSYRDIRMKQLASPSADDTGSRADNPNRTMLGQTQLDWVEQTLLDAQNNGTIWKFVATSSPIDQIGAIGSGADGGKSWMGGYRAERNALLKFIDDHDIQNVVFLSTDDHVNRTNEVLYSPTGTTADQSTYKLLPNAFSIVAGPMGATGPDGITNHSFANINGLANSLVNSQIAAGVNPIGLDPADIMVHDVWREGDVTPGIKPVDFYSPDTYNFTSLEVSPDGTTLTVNLYGVNSYLSNSRPEPNGTNPLRLISSFKVTAVPEPGSFWLLAAGGIAVAGLARRRRHV